MELQIQLIYLVLMHDSIKNVVICKTEIVKTTMENVKVVFIKDFWFMSST
jgi:hypothetical protein